MARRCSMQSDWSNLFAELLELIMEKLDCVDLVCCKAVCCAWKMVAESYIKSSPLYNQIPPLLLPSDQVVDAPGCPTRTFINFADNKCYEVKKVFGRFSDACCIGSSCGWLVIMDEESNPSLVNPYSGVEIRLPSLETLPESKKLVCLSRSSRITKTIISSNPSRCNGFIAVIMVCSHIPKLANCIVRLAFCKHGDVTWTHFGNEQDSYSDILFHKGQLYTLSRHSDLVEVWDFQDQYFPKKVTSIECSTPLNYWRYGNNLLIAPYLVESKGQILLALRLMGRNKKMQTHGYLAYRFAICKLDYNKKIWVLTKFLSDRAELIAEYHGRFVDERNSKYNRDDYLSQSLVRYDRFYW